MVYTPRVVGSDRPGVQPQQMQQVKPANDISDSLLKNAGETNIYGYNALQQGVENLAKLTAQTTENAIARNDSATKMAVSTAQYAGQTQARFAQEMAQASKVMQDWEVLNRQKREDKIKQEQYTQKAAIDADKAGKDAEKEEYERWFNELKYGEGRFLDAYDRQTAEKNRGREELSKNLAVAQAKHYSEQKAKAFVAVRDVMATMQQDAYSQNPLYVRNKLLEAVGKYDVRPEDIPELLGPGYTSLGEIDKSQFDKRQEYADKTQTQLVTQQKLILANKISGALARLKTDGSGNIEPLLEEIEGQVSSFIKDNPSMGVLDTITLQNYALEEANKSVTVSAENRAKISSRLDSNKLFVNELGPLVEQLNGGDIGVEQYKFQLEDLATKYGIPIERAADLGDPLAAKKFMFEQMELQGKLRDLQEEGQLSDMAASDLSDLQVGTLAIYFSKHPDQYNAIKNGAGVFNKDPSFLRAEGLMIAYKEFTKKKSDSEQEYRKLEQQQRAFGEDTLKASKAAVDTTTSTDFKQQIQQKMQVYFGGTAAGDLNPEAYATWEMFRTAGNDLFEKQKAAVMNSYSEEYSTMQQYGLHDGEKSAQFTQAKYDAIRKQIDTVHSNARPQQSQKGVSPNFNPGAPNKTSTQYARANWKGTSMITPFKAGTQFTVGHGHGAAGSPNHGRNRPHSGIDFAVASGTPLVSTGNGVISLVADEGAKKGYGKYVDIKFDDGTVQRFAHLSGTYLNQGQRVTAGQVFAKTGDTGRSSGPHLHWEFRKGSDYGYENSLDPVSNANRLSQTIGTVRPRGDNLDWQSGYNPYGGTHPNNLGAIIPKNAVPLWGGAYILNNKVHYTKGGEPKSVDTYNRRNVVSSSSMPRTKEGFNSAKDNNPSMNYHYNVLAKDNEFRKAIHKTANNLNIPSVWLADIMAFETGGSFNPGIDNGVGYTGLIQFGDAAAKDVGTTRSALSKMSRAQQMSYVEKYYKVQMKYAGITSIDNIETALALVWGGAGLVKRFKNNPESVRNVSDQNTNFKGYLNELGRHGGRKYSHYFSERRGNMAKVIHTKYVDGCATCNQMTSSNSKIAPHEAG